LGPIPTRWAASAEARRWRALPRAPAPCTNGPAPRPPESPAAPWQVTAPALGGAAGDGHRERESRVCRGGASRLFGVGPRARRVARAVGVRRVCELALCNQPDSPHAPAGPSRSGPFASYSCIRAR
jgi:hypothetical protein